MKEKVSSALHSTALNKVEYNLRTRDLTVFFVDGSIKVYRDVPKHVYDGLIHAESSGRYFNFHIRNIYSVAA